MLKRFPLRVPTNENFCLHLAERHKDGKTTTYNNKKVRVKKWRLMPDKRHVEFTIEEAAVFENQLA
ncbi:hypothetical protein I3271_05465 [Photobacterium leiognathi]|uniref:hypothetical protein n=1 Tax=Photobacterium leiognathi TaxID=553611 RepID=UPI001EDFBF6B|nr:hypothetical protein [Photobacterium leiognathi]MCG3884129.1 hypothetical protein [Photobacterium leiognathi]